MLFLKYFPWNEKRKLFRSLLANGSKRRSTTTYVHTRYSFSILFKQYVFPNIMLVSCRKMCKKRRDKMKFERRWSGKYYSSVTLTRKNIGEGKKNFLFSFYFARTLLFDSPQDIKKVWLLHPDLCAACTAIVHFNTPLHFLERSSTINHRISFHESERICNNRTTNHFNCQNFKAKTKTRKFRESMESSNLSPVFLRYTVVHQRISTLIIKNKLWWVYNGVYECLNTLTNHCTR